MTQDVARIIASDRFKRAQEDLAQGHERFVDEIIELTQIPAPPFKEEVRAAAYAEKFRALGLQEVELDGIGNVLGLRRGRGNGQVIVVAAHLDTVFPEGTDVTVRREGTKLFAPGVGDDTRGLAALLAFIRALDAAGIETEQDILFVGDVGEEGKGDLRGIRYLFEEGAYREKIAGFFTIDGLEVGEITTGAVGSLRYRVTFRGPGGHSLNAFGTVNPAYALGSLMAGMARIEVPEAPRTTFCASVMGGGSSINAIPEEVWLEVDLRSVDAGELGKLDAALHALVEEAVAGENARGGQHPWRDPRRADPHRQPPGRADRARERHRAGGLRGASGLRLHAVDRRQLDRCQHPHEPRRAGDLPRLGRHRRTGAQPRGMDRRGARAFTARALRGAGLDPRHGGDGRGLRPARA
ncbi:M20/M25/M40 family metallo-hydrolase [Alloyangia mangrovi]|uniref:M20/M25/M40 family metallo-hydrolase n=1 Tax=Alloyangia mangrovi TaxID=1779329 RepID=UPI0021A5F479|nr:M20/M25/M40 family metallo-hydrolase [Alloyangia mangrovi]